VLLISTINFVKLRSFEPLWQKKAFRSGLNLCTLTFALFPLTFPLFPFPFSLFTIHYSLFTLTFALFPFPFALCPLTFALFTIHYSLFTIHYSPKPASPSFSSLVKAIIRKLTTKNKDNNKVLFLMLPVICSIMPKPSIPITMANFSVLS
jgi:hypothetical protein